MKKVIFTQEWMALHPYEKPDAVDQYYTELANEIYHALDEACFTHQFKNVEDAKQLALSITAYFEDIIAGTCIWKTFTAECKERYGSYIPFYENEKEYFQNAINDDIPEYDPDEINFADIKFICWHHYQQNSYIQEVVPFLFSTMELAAKLAYKVLDREYETAPENERLYAFLCEKPTFEIPIQEGENENKPTEKDFREVYRRDVLAWFHYGCYFNVGNQKRLQFTLQQMANSPQGLTEPLAYSIQMDMTIRGRNNLLALTSAEWLGKICEHQPTHELWEDEDFKKMLADTEPKIEHEKAIHDYNLLKEKGYGDKFIFLEDVKTLKTFLKDIGFELSPNIKFPQKYEKGIIVSASPYTGINISFGLAHCIASPENPYYNTERASVDSFNIISGNGRPFPYEIVCKLIEKNMVPDANIFTSRFVQEEGLKVTQDYLQFLADYYLMGRKDKDLSPKELW